MSGTGRIVVTCPRGVQPYLEAELSALGFLKVLAESPSSVTTEGSIQDAMRLNLHLRTAHRVLFMLSEFRAADPDEMYRAVYGIVWEDLIDEREYLCITSTVETESIRDTRFANLKCKDAIVDRIRGRRGKRPDSGPRRDGAVVHLYWKGEKCAIFMDTSGEPLSRRSYRKIPLKAPMQETLAAAVVAATGWQGKGNFVNPMCGSGTLAIEAALIGINRAPGILRDNFGFMHIKGFNARLWKSMRAEAAAAERAAVGGKIMATDISAEAVKAARKNAALAGVAGLIEFGVSDYRKTLPPAGGGVVILNPEYGERMGEVKALEAVYGGIGDYFKQECMGYTGFIFTGNPALAKKVGLRTSSRDVFYNGPIECRLLRYDLYEGSKKAIKNKQGT